MSDPRRRGLFNPFYVLGLPVEASRAEVEREGQKLLGMLAPGPAACRRSRPGTGPAPRTPEAVREAMAELRDPERRLMHELWARVPAPPGSSAGASVASPAGLESGAEPTGAPWPEALAILGWQRRAARRQS
jgi:hypothetical protein